jgi:hypothetical protein
VCSVLALAPAGCSEKPKFQENKAADHLRKIAIAFDNFNHGKGHPPKDAEDIKPILKLLSPKENPDDVLRSPNDGEPYEILWGVNLERQTEFGAIFAHEKKGVDGKRYVITVSRLVSQMTDAELQGATFARGKR